MQKEWIIHTENELLQGITVYMTNIPTEWVPREKSMICIHCVGKLELLVRAMEILVSNSSL